MNWLTWYWDAAQTPNFTLGLATGLAISVVYFYWRDYKDFCRKSELEDAMLDRSDFIAPEANSRSHRI